MSLTLLKWLAIVLPLLFLAAIDSSRLALFRDHPHGPAALAFFFGVAAVGISLFSHTVFGVINRLQGRILRQNAHLAALNSIAASSAESPGLEPLLQTALDQLLGVLRADAGLICSVDLVEEEHSAMAACGFSPELVGRIRRAKLGDDPVAAQVVRTKRPVVMERVLDDPRVAEIASREGIRSAISAPLKSHGEVTGILVVATRRERRFTAADLELLASVGSQLGMAIRNASLFEKSAQRNREVEALLAVSRAVTSSLALPQVLDRALDAILAVTSADAAEIWLADQGEEFLLKRHRGAAPEAFRAQNRVRLGEGFPGMTAQTRTPVVLHDLAANPSFPRTRIKEAGFQTYCGLPLLQRGAMIGILGVAARVRDALTKPEELQLMVGIGEVISVAIENARLYERVQDEAVLEERERISREMHDGLAQVLGYINTETLAIRRFLASGRLAQAQEELARMEEAARQVYADVREAILGLRTSPGVGGGLLPSLRDYLEAYHQMTGIRTEMNVRGEPEAMRVSPSVEIQLMRIVQEALSNVRKHARATQVTVSLERDGADLQVAVEDDGRGFDPGERPSRGWPRFGLQTMRERAKAVGGSFRLTSTSGGGTRVLIRLPAAPLDTEEKVHASAPG